ncbi:MAG: hypothetical protein ACKV0T_25970 [Planctomycetales bacterium]
MYGRLITLLVAVLFGLMGTLFVFNWLWAKFFGGGPVGGRQVQTSPEEEKQKKLEERAKLREENQARQAEKLKRERHSTKAINEAAQRGVAQPLNDDELDPRTGKVAWPKLLTGSDYGQERRLIEQWLAERAAAPTERRSPKAPREAVEAMLTTLRGQIRDLPTNDYIAARKFLESLAASLRPAEQ